jgi:NADH:ubiquinone oxidoreductase subunit B-like Fe-S oxidoreductase
VDIYIPGCPARPEAIINGVAQLLALAEKKIGAVKESQESPEELAAVGRVARKDGVLTPAEVITALHRH